MNKKICATPAEAKELFEKVIKEGKVATIVPAADGVSYQVQWIDDKNYIAQDGKEYPDEVWVTKEKEMIFIQDLTEAHAKNILRMIIRQDREALIVEEKLRQKIMEHINSAVSGEDEILDKTTELSEEDFKFDTNPGSNFDVKIPQKRTLH